MAVLLLCSLLYPEHARSQRQTEIYLIGTTHDSSAILTPTMLFNILEEIAPSILLQENDSEQIARYTEEIRPNSNEQNATLRYLHRYPATLNLPFEFEGRNQYRKENGMVPTDRLTIALMDSLYQSGALAGRNLEIYQNYQAANTALMKFAQKNIAAMNLADFEAANRLRQHIQHEQLPLISESMEIFARRYLIKPNGERISYRDGYRLWCNFWNMRNNTMALNIIRHAYEHRGSRIVVLTGAQHKYYLKDLLSTYDDGNYKVIEYFRQ